jgi:hypothetical protein
MVAEIRANLIGAVFFSDDSRVNRDSTEFSLLLRDCERHDVLLVSDGRVSDVRDPAQRLVKQISGPTAAKLARKRDGWASLAQVASRRKRRTRCALIGAPVEEPSGPQRLPQRLPMESIAQRC